MLQGISWGLGWQLKRFHPFNVWRDERTKLSQCGFSNASGTFLDATVWLVRVRP